MRLDPDDEHDWMSFTPDMSGAWMLQGLSEQGFSFTVYTGSSLASLTPHTCVEGGNMSVAMDMVAGTEYSIQISDLKYGPGDTEGVMRAVYAGQIRGMSQVVDTLGDGVDDYSGMSTSAVQFADGRVGIAHLMVDEAAYTDHVVRYSERDLDGVWTSVTIDTFATPNIGQLSLVALPNGEPGFAYDRDVQLWWAERDTGGTWSTEVLDLDGPGGWIDPDIGVA